MQKIQINYNPYNKCATLRINGKQSKELGPWRDSFVGRPMEEWLNPSVFSYKKWDGFFTELVCYLNDDDLQIIFYGLADDFHLFNLAFAEQSQSVEDHGYENDLIRIEFQEGYCLDDIRRRLLQFVEDRLVLADTQDSIIYLNYVKKQLYESSLSTFDQICSWKTLLEELIKNQIAISTDEKSKNMWLDARNQINKVFAQ